MNKKYLMKNTCLAILASLLTSCISKPVNTVVTLPSDTPSKLSITSDEVNTMTDLEHRLRAKELGIMYVDYLHMINSGKRSATQSSPVMYHKFSR